MGIMHQNSLSSKLHAVKSLVINNLEGKDMGNTSILKV